LELEAVAGCCNKPSHWGGGDEEEEEEEKEQKDDEENELSLRRQTNVLANTVGTYMCCL
jgi:TATA-binding protein-associated factor Taf7